jgi:hypothetical protein
MPDVHPVRRRFGQGIEAQNSAALRDADPSFKGYNRRTHAGAIALENLIGDEFSVKTLRSIAAKLPDLGAPKIGRDDRRSEWSLVKYLTTHFDLVAQMWRISATNGRSEEARVSQSLDHVGAIGSSEIRRDMAGSPEGNDLSDDCDDIIDVESDAFI